MNEPPASSPSPAPLPAPANEGFNKEHTLFLIDLMRQNLAAEGEGLPKTLQDLNSRLKITRANKKMLWKEAAQKLGGHFEQTFCPDKVARKWHTLVDAYKKVKDNNRSTGKGTMRFQFYFEMDDLLADNHDVVFPVVGTAAGLEVRRPEALVPTASAPQDSILPRRTEASSPTNPTPSKRRRPEEDIMEFLRESEVASKTRHQETLAQLKSAQLNFESLISKLIDKL